MSKMCLHLYYETKGIRFHYFYLFEEFIEIALVLVLEKD